MCAHSFTYMYLVTLRLYLHVQHNYILNNKRPSYEPDDKLIYQIPINDN